MCFEPFFAVSWWQWEHAAAVYGELVALTSDTRPKVRKEAVSAVYRVLVAMEDSPVAARASERVRARSPHV
eukprot:2275439-Pyramimonas_sp.AAC.2